MELPLIEFGKLKSQSDGLYPYCKTCVSNYDKAYRSKNPEKHQPINYKYIKVDFIENEIWLDIKGYEGQYQVSNMGRILSKERTVEVLLRGRKTTNKVFEKLKVFYSAMGGYYGVLLSQNGKNKSYRVHRLIAKEFIENPENKPYINHINGIKTDNRVENLEWCTASENLQHAYNIGLMNRPIENCNFSKLSLQQITEIRNTYKRNTALQLSKQFNVTRTTIYNIVHFKTWKTD